MNAHSKTYDELLLELAAARQSLAQQRALIDTLDVSLCRWRPDTTLVYTNLHYQQLFGLADDGVGHKWLDAMPASTRAENAAFYADLAAHPRTVSYDRPVTLRDGRVRHYHWVDTPVFNDAGELAEFQSVGVDITDRVLAEEARRESETRAQAMLHAIPDLMFRLDRHGVFLDYKADVRDLYAQSEPTLIGRRNRDIAPPEFADLIDRQVEAAFATGAVQTFDYQLDIPGRGRRTYEARLTPSGANEVLAVVRDITERKQVEAHLAASRQRLTSVIDSAMDAIIAVDGDLRFVLFNAAAERMFGVSAADMLGQPLDRIIPDRFQAAHRAHLAQLSTGAYPAVQAGRVFPITGRRANGQEFPAETAIAYVDSNGEQLYTAILRDISERKAAEVALRASEEKYRSLLGSVDSVIVMFDAEGRFVYLNDVAARQLGGTPDQFIGLSMGDVFPEPVASSQLQEVQHVIVTDQPYVSQRESIVRGQARWYRTSMQPMHDETGRAVQVLLNTTDVTVLILAQRQLQEINRVLEERVAERTEELARANASLAAAIDRLQDLDRLKSKFVSDVSHELRTPVTSLSLYIDLLEHGKPEKRAQYVGKLQEQMTRLHKLIDDILDLSRLERDRAELSRLAVDVNAIAEHISALERGAAEARGLTLTCEVTEGLPPVLAQPDLLTRALTNLVSNAIKYTPAGSVRLRTCRCDAQVCVQVSDTGRGISADDLPHLFDRFYRGQDVVRANIPGTGLGLAIVKEIVEAHGGTVTVTSEVGVGSTFSLWLPEAT